MMITSMLIKTIAGLNEKSNAAKCEGNYIERILRSSLRIQDF